MSRSKWKGPFVNTKLFKSANNKKTNNTIKTVSGAPWPYKQISRLMNSSFMSVFSFSVVWLVSLFWLSSLEPILVNHLRLFSFIKFKATWLSNYETWNGIRQSRCTTKYSYVYSIFVLLFSFLFFPWIYACFFHYKKYKARGFIDLHPCLHHINYGPLEFCWWGRNLQTPLYKKG